MKRSQRVARKTLSRRLARWADQRLGAARYTKGLLSKVFPDHWSFLIGELVLWLFVVLILTGIYLTFFFEPSLNETVYRGSYSPLVGVEMTEAYRSTLDLSFDVRSGLVMRQMHHWAALLFVATMVVHLARVFFTGAFRRPREINWIIGVTLLLLGIFNGFAGYSLVDDQLSGTGLRIAHTITLSIPAIGTWAASLLFGGEFPGPDIITRLYAFHILLIPALIGVLLAAHLGLVIRHKHTQFAGEGRTNDNVVGERLWPTYAAKALGLLFLTAGFLALLGGVFQINPIWLYGPFDPSEVSAASQPDWYMGWLDGALRLMPPREIRAFGFEIPNPFFPGVLMPGLTFGALYAWPFIEARFTGENDREYHIVDRPRDRPLRTALGVATFAFYVVLHAAGGSDVIAKTFGLSISTVFTLFRVMLFALPVTAALITRRLCMELQWRDAPTPISTTPASREP